MATARKKEKKIDVANFKTSLNGLRELKSAIQEKLGDKFFKVDDWQTLIYLTLKELKQVSAWVKNEPTSIEKASGVIVKHFYRKAIVSVLTENGTFKRETEKVKSNLDKYTQDVLRIKKLPSELYNEIEKKVKRHLKELSDLILWFEKHTYLKKLIAKDVPPSNHEEAKMHDFYKRCIKEQKIILNYYLNDLKNRVVQKSTYIPFNLDYIADIQAVYLDYPYKFAIRKEYFDHRLINKSWHRCLQLTEEEAEILGGIYKRDKKLFYKKLFKVIPTEEIFKRIEFNLQHLPIKEGRKIIFQELKRLYKSKKWMAFYALSLPQVEGLFTEMFEVIYPGKTGKSLSNKVEEIRPYHSLSEYYFDYYQYEVPELRNRFMHTGYDEDFEVKAFDLLTDLDNLLSTFYELENPLVKIKKLHTQKNPKDFISYKQYGEYFSLLNSISNNQKESIKKQATEFEKDFLNKDCNVEFICDNICESLPKVVKELTTKIEYSINSASLAIDLQSISLPKAKKLIENTLFASKIKDFYRYYSTEIDDLEAYYHFLSGYKKYLPSLNKETIDKLNKLQKENGGFVNNVIELKKLSDKIVSED